MGVEEKAKVLRVLVAEGSSYSRMVLQELLGPEQGVQLTNQATNGEEMLRYLRAGETDLLVLDHDLPGNENMLALKCIQSEVPVLLLLRQDQLTPHLVQQAEGLGVYDVVLKPGKGRFYTDYRSIAQEVLQKVEFVRDMKQSNEQLSFKKLRQRAVQLEEVVPADTSQDTTDTIIVIGASTGGTQAVERVIRELAPDLQATVLVALHLPHQFTRAYAKRLQTLTSLRVTEGRRGLKLKPGEIIVAPGGRNMVVQPVVGNRTKLVVSFTEEQTTLFDQPSIDLLMRSVAQSAVKRVIGVILTGMGKDGTAGAAHIRARGGMMLAQDEETSAIFGMAKSAIESGYINEVLPLQEIPQFLNNYVAGQQVSTTDRIYEIERAGV